MEILLDTNFIVTCVKNNIYFDSLADELIDEEIKWIVPQDVLNELGLIKDGSGSKKEDREAAKIGFEVLQALKPEVVELPGNGKNVDIKIVNYILDTDIVLATLDKNLKNRVNNRILGVRGKNSIEFV